ncbi:hypothetical protein O6H91_11G006100 [Diphasiastrum complanatum]|nr:hypothetical protein O6H91_11G006100 [Diphasiastrum complanatum]KAJ7537449.1 hypothetical protein O6H91_11G006100 [Diphasiastrum complanatum]
MAEISDAACRTEDREKIMQVLRQRLDSAGGKNWRQLNKSLILLEYLITHGPERIVGEISFDRDAIEELTRFQFIDERGYDRGSLVRNKATRVLQLITEADLLKEERERAQKISQGIRGFGSSSSGTSAVSSTDSKLEGFGNFWTPKASPFHDFDATNKSLLQDEDGVRNQDFVKSEGMNFDTDWHPFEKTTQTAWHPFEKTHSSTNDSNNNWHPFEEKLFTNSALIQTASDDSNLTIQKNLEYSRNYPRGLNKDGDKIQRSFKLSSPPRAATVLSSQPVPDLIDL